MPFGNTNGPAKRTPGISAIARWTPSASRQSRSTSMWRRRPVKTWNFWRARPPPLPTWAPMKRTRTRSPPAGRPRCKGYAVSAPTSPLPPIIQILPLLRCREHLFEILERLGTHAFGGKSISGDQGRRSSEPPPQRFVSEHAIDSFGQGDRIPRRYEERRDPVLDHVQGARNRRRDDRFLERHRLNERVRTALHVTGEGDEGGPPQARRQLRTRNRSEEFDAIRSEPEGPGVPTPGFDPTAPRHDESFGTPKMNHGAEEDGQALPAQEPTGVQDETRFFRRVRRSSGRSQFIEGEAVRNERGCPHSRAVGPEDLLTNRIRDEEDVANPVPVVQLDREESGKDGQGRPLCVVQRPAVSQRALDPSGLSEDRRMGRHDRGTRHGIRPEVRHLRVVDDQQVRAIFPDEIWPAALEGSLKLEVVRHDAAPVGEGHGLVAGIVRRRLAAQAREVSRRVIRERSRGIPRPEKHSPTRTWSRCRLGRVRIVPRATCRAGAGVRAAGPRRESAFVE